MKSGWGYINYINKNPNTSNIRTIMEQEQLNNCIRLMEIFTKSDQITREKFE